MKQLFLILAFIFCSIQLFAHEVHDKCYQLIGEEEFQEAFVLALTTLNDADPEVVSEGYYIMGYARRKQNYFSEALHYYERAIEHSFDLDKKGKIINNIVILLQFTSLHEQAIKEADRAIELSEKWRLVSIYNKTYSLHVLKRHESALETLSEGVRICKEEGNDIYILKLWNLQAEIEVERGNLTKAQSLLEHVVSAGSQVPTDGKPYMKSRAVELGKAKHQLGLLKLSRADTAQAQANFKASLEIQVDKQERFYSLLELARITKNNEMLIRSALELYPSLTLTEKTLKVFFLAGAKGLLDMAVFEKEFDSYVKQENSIKETYTAYIGRQIVREKELLDRNTVRMRWNWIFGIASLLAIFVALFVYFRK